MMMPPRFAFVTLRCPPRGRSRGWQSQPKLKLRRLQDTASSAGFTLIELLVALALLAITSALAFRGLTAVGDHRNRVEGQRLRSVQIEQTFAQLQADVDHLMTMTGAAIGPNAPPVMQRVDGIVLLRRPRALLADNATQATANEATIDAIRYQATNEGLVRTVLGRSRDPIDMVGRVLVAVVTTDADGKATDGLSKVTLLPDARGIEMLAWSTTTAAGSTPGGEWLSLAQFNSNYNNPELAAQNSAQGTSAPNAASAASSGAASAPAVGASNPTAGNSAASSWQPAATPRALKVRIKLDTGAILERIYMAGPNA